MTGTGKNDEDVMQVCGEEMVEAQRSVGGGSGGGLRRRWWHREGCA